MHEEVLEDVDDDALVAAVAAVRLCVLPKRGGT